MKKPLIAASLLFLLAAAFVVTTLGGPIALLTRNSCDWKFVQAVGGMKVALEDRRLKVLCDVSGTRTITTKPTLVNSGIGVRKVKCGREGNTLQLTIVTSLFEKGMSTGGGSIDLSDYPAGTWTVEYRDPDGTTHPLGQIQLP